MALEYAASFSISISIRRRPLREGTYPSRYDPPLLLAEHHVESKPFYASVASPLEDVSELLRLGIRCSLKGSRTDLENLHATTASFHGGLMLAYVVWGEIARFDSG